MATKRPARARAAYAEVLKLSEGPLAARAQFQTGEALRQEGSSEAALDAWLKVSILYAHGEWVRPALLESARLLLSKGSKAQAARLLTELITDHPDTEEARTAKKLLESNS